MSKRVSRRKIAVYVADQLLAHNERALLQAAAYLIESKSLDQVDLLARDIEAELALRGTVIADLLSAREIAGAARAHIETLLKDTYAAREIIVREHVDEALMGGFVLRTPDSEYDQSVRRKLQMLMVRGV